MIGSLRKAKTYMVNEESGMVKEPQIPLQYPDISTNNVDAMSEKKRTLNVLSLFSGCGGMDLGFEGGFTTFSQSINEDLCPDFIERKLNRNTVLLKRNRFKTVFANDILEEARFAWINYFSKRDSGQIEKFHSDSIVDLVKLHKNGVKIFPDKVDVVTGGFPCQDFSIAGKRNGFDSHKDHKGEIIEGRNATVETRGQLYMWMKQVIESTEPNIFIAENVKGLVNLDNVKEIIQSDFSKANGNGYLVLDPQVLHAADFGVPQSRERVIFIGIKKSALKKSILKELTKKEIPSEYNPYPSPTHAYTTNEPHLKEIVRLRDIFKGLPEPEVSRDLSHKYYSKAKFMGKHCQGQIEVRQDSIAPTIRAEHHGNIEFRRLSIENGGKQLDEIAVGLKERRLTPRECGMIQTFPTDFKFVIESSSKKGSFLVSPSKAYKIIGNAVPPLLAFNIADRIEKIWDVFFNQ